MISFGNTRMMVSVVVATALASTNAFLPLPLSPASQQRHGGMCVCVFEDVCIASNSTTDSSIIVSLSISLSLFPPYT